MGRPKGFYHSEETKRKIGMSSSGKKLSPEHIDFFRKLHTGNKYRLGKYHTEETKKKISLTKKRNPVILTEKNLEDKSARCKGDKNWNWKGGVESENRRIRKSYQFKHWSKSVFERDDFTCQECGVRGGNLNPHHILPFADFPEFRFYIGNGVTLCRKHHYDNHKGKKEKFFPWLKPYMEIYSSAFGKEN